MKCRKQEPSSGKAGHTVSFSGLKKINGFKKDNVAFQNLGDMSFSLVGGYKDGDH